MDNKEELKEISDEELNIRFTNHLKYLRGDNSKKNNNFSNIRFSSNNDCKIFSGRDLKESNFKNSIFLYGDRSSYDIAPEKPLFDFTDTILIGADFRGDMNFDTSIFSNKQLNDMILTDKDYEKYQENKKLEEENSELKKDVKDKDKTLKDTSEKNTNVLIDSFEKLEKQFLLEEKRWLIISFVIFFGLFLYLFVPILDIIAFKYMPKILIVILIVIIGLIIGTIIGIFSNGSKNKVNRKEYKKLYKNTNVLIDSFKKIKFFFIKNIMILFNNTGVLIYNIFHIFKKILFDFGIILILSIFLTNILLLVPEPEKSILTGDLKFILLPLGILLSSFLYFSIFQYSKSKKLRIENGNKVALLHGFIAIRADTGEDMSKGRFYDNVANVVFSKIYNGKESNLPIDKVIDIVNLIVKK